MSSQLQEKSLAARSFENGHLVFPNIPKNSLLCALLTVCKSVLWDFSGLALIFDKIAPSQNGGKKPSLVLWLITVYVTLFGFAESRYLNKKNELNNRLELAVNQLSSNTSPLFPILGEVADINRSRIPKEVSFGFDSLESPLISLFSNVERDSRTLQSSKLFLVAYKKDLSGLNLTKVDLSHSDLSDANFEYATLTNTNFAFSNLNGAKFEFAKLNGTIFINSHLRKSVFEDQILTSSVTDGASFLSAHLDGADFSGMELFGMDFRKSKLAYAIFKKASLVAGKFSAAKLNGADLSGSDISYARFFRADLRGFKSTQTDLRDTIFNEKTNFKMAKYNQYTLLPFEKQRMAEELGMIFIDYEHDPDPLIVEDREWED